MKKKPDKIGAFLLIAAGAAGIMDTAVLLLSGIGVNLGIVFPGLVGILIIVYYGLFLTKNEKYRKINGILFGRPAKLILAAVFLSFIIIESLILINAHPDRDVPVDYLVILGAGLKGDQMTITFANRMLAGVDYLNKHPDVKVIVTGGQGPGETITEGEAMSRFLTGRGISPGRIIKEDKATSTNENFKYSRELLMKDTGKSSIRVMIVTSDFHMFRAKMLAGRNGFTAYGIPAKTWGGVYLNSAVREYFAVIKSLMFDW